jgi:hypothetical protein
MSSTTAADSPLLSDFLGTQRSLTTFSSLLRQHDSAASLVSSSSSRATLLAPLNSAVEALPRRPWERPGDYDSLGTAAYEGNDGKERADKNTRLFVDAHVLPQSPWQSGDKVKTLAGREVWWEEMDGKRLIMPEKIEVERVANKAGNGELVGLALCCWITVGTTVLILVTVDTQRRSRIRMRAPICLSLLRLGFDDL